MYIKGRLHTHLTRILHISPPHAHTRDVAHALRSKYEYDYELEAEQALLLFTSRDLPSEEGHHFQFLILAKLTYLGGRHTFSDPT